MSGKKTVTRRKAEKPPKKPVKHDSDNESVDNAESVIDMPELEYVSEVTKERYEYKPVIRSEIVYVHPDNRITSEIMSKFELCEVRSHRAKQLESGLPAFTDIGNLTDPLAIANKEILDKKCPLDIVRVILEHNNMKIAEKWHVNEMGIPPDVM
jgi:DNA-directed RNA polymerase I, II, and III subunit RPABC2